MCDDDADLCLAGVAVVLSIQMEIPQDLSIALIEGSDSGAWRLRHNRERINGEGKSMVKWVDGWGDDKSVRYVWGDYVKGKGLKTMQHNLTLTLTNNNTRVI